MSDQEGSTRTAPTKGTVRGSSPDAAWRSPTVEVQGTPSSSAADATTVHRRPVYRDLMDAMTVELPEGELGEWKIERFTIDGTNAFLFNLGESADYGRRAVQPGTYTRLLHGDMLYMSDTPAEKADHLAFVFEAWLRGGDILIHGLGLGMALKAVLASPQVDHVDVVELDSDVIKLVGQHFVDDERVQIHQGDALTFKFPAHSHWTCVWHDIWPDIDIVHKPEMNRLMRRYGRSSDWQSYWARPEITRMQREGGWS